MEEKRGCQKKYLCSNKQGQESEYKQTVWCLLIEIMLTTDNVWEECMVMYGIQMQVNV